MVAMCNMKSLEKEAISHYQIKDIKYSRRWDKFNIRLTSYFKEWPEIKASVSYYNRDDGLAVAYIGSIEYRLTSTNATYVEDIAKEVTDKLRDVLREAKHGNNEKPKRLSIFGPS